MSGYNDFEKLDPEILVALGNEVRLEILNILGKGELNVTEITEKLSLSRPAVSHHLQILRRATIVEPRREGKEIYYSVNMKSLQKISEGILHFIVYGSI